MSLFLCSGLQEPRALHAQTPAFVIVSSTAASSPDLSTKPDLAVSGTYRLPPGKLARATAYSRNRTTLHFAEEAWSAVLLLLLLTLKIAAWMRQAAERTSRNPWLQASFFVLMFLLLTTVLELPLDMLGHRLAVTYGQSVQHWPSWFADQSKTFGLTYIVCVPLVMLLFWVMKRSPHHWWFWFWVPTMLSSLVAVFVWPIFVDPLFNHFEPLQHTNPALVEQLERVVARGGIDIPPNRMFLMKASTKVTGLNAYVTGFGSTKRVVVWDTSVQKATPDEISFIFAHEMGHYVLNHIYLGLAFTAVFLLVSFWLGYLCLTYLLRRYGTIWRITGEQDWAVLVVFVFVLAILSFLGQPVANAFSRWEEHAADVYGQEAMHGILVSPRRTGAETFQLLGEESLTDPEPNSFVEFWTYSHPSINQRMAFAAAYNPWTGGSVPKYFPR